MRIQVITQKKKKLKTLKTVKQPSLQLLDKLRWNDPYLTSVTSYKGVIWCVHFLCDKEGNPVKELKRYFL